jgi:hypothetical protein
MTPRVKAFADHLAENMQGWDRPADWTQGSQMTG